MSFTQLKLIAISLSLLTISGCLDKNDDDSKEKSINSISNTDTKICSESNPNMVIQTISDDHKSSEVALGCSQQMQIDSGYLKNIASDYTVAAGADNFYQIGRSFAGNDANTMKKFSFELASKLEWQYATLAPGESDSNAYDLIEVNENKAYLLRYDTSTIWIVNPSANSFEYFKIGELDLSQYTNGSSTQTNMAVGTIIGDRLYVGLQRLHNGSSFVYTEPSLVAVFDINSDQEIDSTPEQVNDFNAVVLNGVNIQSIFAYDGTIYTASRGDYGNNFGYLESLNTETFETEIVVNGSSSVGHIVDSVVMSNTLGFVLTDSSRYVDNVWTSKNTLYTFNPSLHDSTTAISQFSNTPIKGIELGPEGYLWVLSAKSSNPGLYKVNPTDTSKYSFMETTLNPDKLAFRKSL